MPSFPRCEPSCRGRARPIPWSMVSLAKYWRRLSVNIMRSACLLSLSIRNLASWIAKKIDDRHAVEIRLGTSVDPGTFDEHSRDVCRIRPQISAVGRTSRSGLRQRKSQDDATTTSTAAAGDVGFQAVAKLTSPADLGAKRIGSFGAGSRMSAWDAEKNNSGRSTSKVRCRELTQSELLRFALAQ